MITEKKPYNCLRKPVRILKLKKLFNRNDKKTKQQENYKTRKIKKINFNHFL